MSPSSFSPNESSDVVTRTGSLPAEAIVTAAKLNIRTGPGTGYAILGHFEAGDSVTVVDAAGDAWVVIEYVELVESNPETRQGYVFRRFLRFLGN